MDQRLPPRLPANLESPVQRVRMAARSAAEHTVDSLGLSALACTSVLQRDALLGAQYELNRKLALFALSFNEALDTDIARQAGTLVPTPAATVTPDALVATWDTLSLVDDHAMEIHLSADRFALEINHACEWEIRELDAYMASLMHLGGADPQRNPLRAEVIGQAVVKAVEAVSDRPEVRKVLCTEISRSLAHAMRQTYADIVGDLRRAGVRPKGLAIRPVGGRGAASQHGGLASAPVALDSAPMPVAPRTLSSGLATTRPASIGMQQSVRPAGAMPPAARPGWGLPAAAAGQRPGFQASGRSGLDGTLGSIDPQLMAVIHQLAAALPGRGWSATSSGYSSSFGETGSAWAAGGAQAAGVSSYGAAGQPLVAPNLILAHRDALLQAASSSMDGMVIDVVAQLFDQILSDNAVPPQMARQIARLQLPVLRAALGDPSFFSARRHPVRRFVNRIASLGSAVEDFSTVEGRALLERVAALVQEVIEGAFDQLSTYEHKLKALEDFVAAQAQALVQARGAADTVLAEKEAQLRVQQRYAQDLDAAFQGLPVPDYLRAFLAETWSRVIATVAAEDGEAGLLTHRMRQAGRELVMSVQPKGTPAARQQFLRQLPQLMKDLNFGLDRIRCAEEQRRAFFAQLLPAHAESLKGQGLSTLEHNLLARQVDGALATPLPDAQSLPAVPLPAVQALASPAVFSPAEAAAVGLVDEAAVDWSRPVTPDPAAEPELAAVDIDISGLPTPEAPEPTRGKSLADHVQIGFAYLMQLQGEWQRVRLAHVSAGRSFFVFTHGAKDRETVSMTYRMLLRLCEANRLRALESAYLIERATARARRQLASIKPAAPRRH